MLTLPVLALAACGGGGGGGAASTTATVAAPPADPCALLAASDVRAALGRRAPAATRAGATCQWSAAPQGLQLQVTAPAAPARASVRAAISAAGSGSREIHTQGVDGLAATIPAPTTAPTLQAQVTLVGPRALVRITLTAPASERETLLARATALGRAAAARL